MRSRVRPSRRPISSSVFGSSSSRPYGRRDELRAARRIQLDLSASYEARQAARERLLELLQATRSNGRPAYSLQGD
jgi:hypothetical protein